MRRGRVFKRCTKCNARIPDRKCPKCGADNFTWYFTVDLNEPGETRQQRMKGGFATKGAATAAMNCLQVEKAEGSYVEPSKLTVGEYLTTWVAAGCGGVEPWTLKGYEVAVRVHIVPRIGKVPLQKLTRDQIKAMYRDLATSGYAKGPTAAQLHHLEDVAHRYRAAAAGAGSPVMALVREYERPEPTVRHWVRRCHQLGLLGDAATAEVKSQRRGHSPKTVHNVHIALRAALNDAVPDLLRPIPRRAR